MRECDWIEDLVCSGPIQFEDAWLRLSNGELWRLCCEGNKEVLEKLHNQLTASPQGFIERLEWWLSKIGLPKQYAPQIFCWMKSLVEDFVYKDGGDWLEYVDQVEGEGKEIPQVTLQGLGVKGANGFVVTLKLELRESAEKKPRLVPHPQCLLLPQDGEFKDTLSRVEQWMQSFSPEGVKIAWRIARSDDDSLDALRGNSLGGLFAVGVWLLVKEFLPDPSITITAALSDNGKLAPVSRLVEKVRAAINFACPRITRLLVAKEQDLSVMSNFPNLPQDFFQPVATVDEAIDIFLTQVAPFINLRKRVAKRFDHFNLSGLAKMVDWNCYQEPSVTLFPDGQKSLSLTDWLRDWLGGEQKHWLLVARSGMGKTTALQYIAHLLSSQKEYRHLLPVFLEAEKWLNIWKELESVSFNPSLAKILATLFSDASSDEFTDKHWANWLERGHVVLLVDQVERVAKNQNFIEHIRMTLMDNGSVRVILAVRSERIDDFRWLDLPSVYLEPLSREQAQCLLVKLGKVLNRSVLLPSQVSEFPPFLIVAYLLLPQPTQGLGRTCVELTKELLKKAQTSLPVSRLIEILSDVFMDLSGKDLWSEDELYDTLREKVSNAQMADEIWQTLTSTNLLVRDVNLLTFAHTLLLEALRAFALAQKWEQKFPIHEADQLLTPTRTLLLASLLDQQVAKDFWQWLKRRVTGEPSKWAETCAYCLSERKDAPISDFASLFYSSWFDAFQRGKEEKQAWASAIAALPEEAVRDYILPNAHQLLQGKPKLAELRASIHLMAIVSDKVTFDPQVVDALVSAYVASDFKHIVAQDIAKLFSPPSQTKALQHFMDRLLIRAEEPRQGFDALEEFVRVAQLPQDLRCAFADRVRLLEQTIQSRDLRKRLYRLLGYFQSGGS